nr:hypothetical protein [Tanacetum cinerariifolium]
LAMLLLMAQDGRKWLCREVVLEGLELRDVGCPIHFEDVIGPKIVIK